MGNNAFRGDSTLKTADEYPYNYNNSLTMKSGNVRSIEYIDLPLLASFIGGGNNFEYYGSGILESICVEVLFRRHSIFIIQ
mgnify:FL=1